MLLSALGGVVSGFSEIVAVMMDASAKITEMGSVVSAYSPYIKSIGLALMIGGTVWAIQRRLSDAANGRQ